MNKPTIVLGASPNPERYSYKAVDFLINEYHNVFPIGIKNGKIRGIEILKDFDKIDMNIHTISIYLNSENQKSWYDKIIEIKPQRVIFNPGTENPELEEILNQNNIENIEACTLVMLRTGQF